MFKGKERETEDKNEVEGEKEGLGEHGYCWDEKGGGFNRNFMNGYCFNVLNPLPKRVKIFGTDNRSDQDRLELSSSVDSSSGAEPQDADYSYILPSLSYELESLILARFPRSEHRKLCFVNKRYLSLVKSGELFKIRREIGYKEPSVFMLATGESRWWAFDREFKSCKELPILPSDECFKNADKESVCAGTHLLVSGREASGHVIWRYDLVMNKWYKGSEMINQRFLFASATCGTSAFVAGGIGKTGNLYDTAEKYNPDSKSWEPLPRMKQRRQLCSGCYMDNKFYVVGGRNEAGELTCGEFFDEARNEWELIPDMLKDDPVLNSHSPPLLAVVNNQLYSLEASSNRLKVYLKCSNKWKQLGPVPVKADSSSGWGVAFKSLGNELLVIGASSVSRASNSMAVYACCPDPDAEELQWRPLDTGRNRLSSFILNCCVMVA